MNMAISRVKEDERRTRAIGMAMGIEVVEFLSLMRSCDLLWRWLIGTTAFGTFVPAYDTGISAWSMGLCFSTLVFSFKELLSGFFVKQKLILMNISMSCAE